VGESGFLQKAGSPDSRLPFSCPAGSRWPSRGPHDDGLRPGKEKWGTPSGSCLEHRFPRVCIPRFAGLLLGSPFGTFKEPPWGGTGNDRQSRVLCGTVLLKQEIGRLESRAERVTAHVGNPVNPAASDYKSCCRRGREPGFYKKRVPAFFLCPLLQDYCCSQ
jgi:hypothetical protein